MKRLLAVTLAIALVAACGDDVTSPPIGEGFTVMTRNIYVGANIDMVLAAPTLESIPLFVADAWRDVQATDFDERAAALADEIAAANPHLVGLQEVSTFRAQSPGDFLAGNPLPATDVVLDHLAVLMDALEARGLSYRVAAVFTGFDVEMPMVSPNGLDDMRLTDHEVILARSDVGIANVREEQFTVNFEAPLGGEGGPTLTVLRGWVAVDATIAGKTIRFVSTHLEPPEVVPQVQVAQADELIAELAGESLPVIIVGDLNSAADGSSTPTYANLLAAGYFDAWDAAGSGGAGLTCCHDDDLQNASANFTKRIDYILFRGGIQALDAVVVGADPAGRSPSGLWPSDHAGLVATFDVP